MIIFERSGVLRLRELLAEERAADPAGIVRSNRSGAWHSRDIDPASLPCPVMRGLTPRRAWFVYFRAGGFTAPHVHAEADVVTVSVVFGGGGLLVEGRKVSLSEGETLLLTGQQTHEALPARYSWAALAVNWKKAQ